MRSVVAPLTMEIIGEVEVEVVVTTQTSDQEPLTGVDVAVEIILDRGETIGMDTDSRSQLWLRIPIKEIRIKGIQLLHKIRAKKIKGIQLLHRIRTRGIQSPFNIKLKKQQ